MVALRTADQTHFATASTSYANTVDELRRTEFTRLGKQVYVDHAGAALYSETQLKNILKDLSTNIFGNPHSQHAQLSGSVSADDTQAAARSLTLDMCSASPAEYDCIFTSGATGGIKLIADAFPWTSESCFAYTRDNHTSVIGTRAVAMRAGASVACVYSHSCSDGTWNIEPSADIIQSCNCTAEQPVEETTHSLFAYPLESNFSGARYDPALSSFVQSKGLSTCQRQATELGHCASATGSTLKVAANGNSLPPLQCQHSSLGQRGSSASSKSSSNGPQSGSTAEQARRSGDGERQGTEAQAGCSSDGRERQRWWVLLDAAKACSTSPPDLSCHKPDFVVLSYYKIFGYPTGLGALLVRQEAKTVLNKAFFGGGTVTACSAEADFVRRRDGPAGYEDGTTSYLGIAALPHGFELIHRLGGFTAIDHHACALTRSLATQLTHLQHFNGQPVCQLYGKHTVGLAEHAGKVCLPGTIGQGPIITLNLLRADASFVGYREVERMANLSSIMLRGGCFCNPGACAAHLGLSASDIKENFEAGHVCWDDNDLVHGRPTGAVRISFGFSSTAGDVAAVLNFVKQHFLQSSPTPTPNQPPRVIADGKGPRLAGIWVYPIKSCGGCAQREWPLGPNGLLYDREWALVGEDNQVLTLKKHPQLAFIQPRLDLETGEMTVSAPRMTDALVLRLPLASNNLHLEDSTQIGTKTKAATVQRQIHICAESVCGMQVGVLPRGMQSAADWFSQAVGYQCALVQQQAGSRQAVQKSKLRAHKLNSSATSTSPTAPIGFANEAQMLLINQASLDNLNARLTAKRAPQAAADAGLEGISAERFRPNLVVDNVSAAFAEDEWDQLSIGGAAFEVAGPCARCEVICVDPTKGVRQGPEPLLTLASFRRTRGRINFGVLLQSSGLATGTERGDAAITRIAVGMPVAV